jgi:hypothetical protein
LARVALAVVGASVAIGVPALASTPDDGLVRSRRYEGTATVVIEDTGSGAVAVVTADAVVAFAPPLAGEPNPFHLAIVPGGTGDVPGAVTVASATPGAAESGPAVQHWSFEEGAADDGALAFSGRLVDNDPLDGAVPNRLSVADADGQLVDLALGAGTRMTGRADDEGVVISLDGTTVDAGQTFQILIEASAVAGSASPAGQQGVINMDSVLLLARPEVVSPTLATLSYGTTVTITGPSVTVPMAGSYLPVVLEDGTAGWVYEPFVDRVGEAVTPATGEAGTISADGVQLVDGPSLLAGVITAMPAGTPVTITGAAVHDLLGGNDYLPVTLADGTTGWVLEGFVVRG